jgi:UDP-glucose 4-epimerase
MAVLITGGAGYIGAHVVDQLLESGEPLVVVDDLSTGNLRRIENAHFSEIDVSSSKKLDDLCELIRAHQIDSIVHFAARKRVDESVKRPLWYYTENINGLLNVLSAMERTGIRDIVFSSSAAVYGETGLDPVTEDWPRKPVNTYGRTKLIGEWILEDASRAHGIRATSLRYFNVAGSKSASLGDSMGLNIVPLVFDAISASRQPVIFGDDYPTPDGTCIRDYIHVQDLARAHVAALHHVRSRPFGSHVAYNVGTGLGTSVREMISIILEVTGSDLTPLVVPRREGDSPSVTANADKIRSELGWASEKSARQMIESAWESYLYLGDESSTRQ